MLNNELYCLGSLGPDATAGANGIWQFSEDGYDDASDFSKQANIGEDAGDVGPVLADELHGQFEDVFEHRKWTT